MIEVLKPYFSRPFPFFPPLENFGRFCFSNAWYWTVIELGCVFGWALPVVNACSVCFPVTWFWGIDMRVRELPVFEDSIWRSARFACMVPAYCIGRLTSSPNCFCFFASDLSRTSLQ